MDDKKNQNQNADVVEEVDLEDMEQVSGGGALRDKTAKTTTHDLTDDTKKSV